MKTIILVRHARSGFDSASGFDIDRTLDPRGNQDAPAMASLLSGHGILPDIFLSSLATRAINTARYFLQKFDTNENDLLIRKDLYEPAVADFYSVIEELPHDRKCAIIFSHNPGITEFIFDLGCKPVYNMSAGSMYAFSLNTVDWKEIRSAEKLFLFFESPTPSP